MKKYKPYHNKRDAKSDAKFVFAAKKLMKIL